MKINKNYFTTSRVMNIENFIEIEVQERGNYAKNEVDEWVDKYGITPSHEIIWVAIEPHIAARYEMGADDWDDSERVYEANSSDFNVEAIDSGLGFLIPETDDGDGGFIFVFYETHWIVTDPSCNQRMKVLTENSFMFKEDRTINPSTGETCEYESVIDLSEYTHEEMFESVSPFGYSFHEMSTWIDEGRNLSLIAECIFEMEN